MSAKVSRFTQSSGPIFESVLQNDKMLINHVVLEVGKIFPKHPTDAHVTIIILQGDLTLKLGEDSPVVYSAGQVIEVEKGIESVLGNGGTTLTELFVIKNH